MTTDIHQHHHNKSFNYSTNGKGEWTIVEVKLSTELQEKLNEISIKAMAKAMEILNGER